MQSANIISAITGVPVEDVREKMVRQHKLSLLSFELYNEIKKVAKDNTEFMSITASSISMLLHDLPVEVRILILAYVNDVVLSGKMDNIETTVQKFKENGKKKIS